MRDGQLVLPDLEFPKHHFRRLVFPFGSPGSEDEDFTARFVIGSSPDLQKAAVR